MTSFGEYLIKERKRIGLSQKEFASRIRKEDGTSISPQYLNDIEHNRRNPPSEYILGQISRELNVSLDYLLYLAGRFPEDIATQSPETFEAAMKAFRKKIKEDKQ